ncbi:MAG: DUF5711 family protein [Oscillospiraceae bacterium]|nr:DUF5711 family protein [Oscillospiraceae bacterium]
MIRDNKTDGIPPQNRRHIETSYKIKLARFIAVFALASVAAAGLLFNSGELSADSFNYLLRYINIIGSGRSEKSEFYAEIGENSKAAAAYYKNGVAVIRRNRLDIYETNGVRRNLSLTPYSNPVVTASDKYIVAYDLGTNKMEVFNSFSKLYEYGGDSPIYGASVTDRGNIVYITSEPERGGYKSAVYVKNSNFSDVFKCRFGEDFIVSADIDDRAQKLAVAGFSAKNGDYLGRIILYETNSEEPAGIIEVTGQQPYRVKLNGAGIFAVFENSFGAYDFGGNALLNYDFAYRSIRAASLTEKFASVVLTEKTLGANDRILIFDEAGGIIYDETTGTEIKDIGFSDDYKFLYFLTRTGLYAVDTERKTCELVTDEYDETADNIIYANNKNIFLSGILKISIADAQTRAAGSLN